MYRKPLNSQLRFVSLCCSTCSYLSYISLPFYYEIKILIRNTLIVTNLMYIPPALFPRLFLSICRFVLSLYTLYLIPYTFIHEVGLVQ